MTTGREKNTEKKAILGQLKTKLRSDCICVS